MNKTDLAQLKVRYTDWADPATDEAKFWRQCADVAEIDPLWLAVRLERGKRKTALIDTASKKD